MIVTKTLKIINKIGNNGKLFLLGNDVVTGRTKLVIIKDSEKEQFIKLMNRNKHITLSTSWIEYIRHISERCVKELNLHFHYKYEDRGWELEEYDDMYRVSIFLDNYDVEQFAYVEIPKESISDRELEYLKNTSGRIF